MITEGKSPAISPYSPPAGFTSFFPRSTTSSLSPRRQTVEAHKTLRDFLIPALLSFYISLKTYAYFLCRKKKMCHLKKESFHV